MYITCNTKSLQLCMYMYIHVQNDYYTLCLQVGHFQGPLGNLNGEGEGKREREKERKRDREREKERGYCYM